MAFRGASNVEKHPSPLEVWIRPTTWMAFLCGSILWMTYHHLEQCPDVVFPCKVTKECVEFPPRKRRNGWKMENGPPDCRCISYCFWNGHVPATQSHVSFQGIRSVSLSSQELGDRIHVSDPMDRIGSHENGYIIWIHGSNHWYPIKKNPNSHYRFL